MDCQRCRNRFQKVFQKEELPNAKKKSEGKIVKLVNKIPFVEINKDELGLSIQWKGALKCG